jgi:hypothetical protein
MGTFVLANVYANMYTMSWLPIPCQTRISPDRKMFKREQNLMKSHDRKSCKEKRVMQNVLRFVDKAVFYFWLITMGSTAL